MYIQSNLLVKQNHKKMRHGKVLNIYKGLASVRPQREQTIVIYLLASLSYSSQNTWLDPKSAKPATIMFFPCCSDLLACLTFYK